MLLRRPAALFTATALALTLAACGNATGTASAEPAEVTGTTIAPGGTGGGDEAGSGQAMADLANSAATTFFTAAPAVVLCDGSDASVGRGTEIATAAGVPLLCGPDPLSFAETIDALGAEHVLDVDGADTTALAEETGATVHAVPADADVASAVDGSFAEDAPALAPAADAAGAGPGDEGAAEGGDTAVALALGDPTSGPARASAQAAGARVITVPVADPRATAESVEALAGAKDAPVVALGDAFGPAEDLTWKLETARTGVQLPGGGQRVVPGKTYIALYGTPGTGSLGLLGEQDTEATVERAQEVAGEYTDLLDTTVVPTLEIIASVAIGAPGTRGTYTNVQTVDTLRPLVDAAKEAGQYVVLDLQPGREDFLTQAQEYEELLREPHVGLALDPEWRLKPDQVHLRQVGQVQVEEVNEVVTWLADLTRENRLPQKFLVLHSFQNRMIVGLDDVDQSRDELEVLVHVDGQGGQQAKQSTWNTLHQYAPSIESWGWKNFIDEDIPMLTPEQTAEQVQPAPVFVSYQ